MVISIVLLLFLIGHNTVFMWYRFQNFIQFYFASPEIIEVRNFLWHHIRVCRFFLSVKFAASLLALLAGDKPQFFLETGNPAWRCRSSFWYYLWDKKKCKQTAISWSYFKQKKSSKNYGYSGLFVLKIHSKFLWSIREEICADKFVINTVVSTLKSLLKIL